ncbi:hypothetical protein IMY05_007G0045500 [Salix suchowensis]|nr:hypothetical protein IMY05_007G0045500 [Salix suchowensis]
MIKKLATFVRATTVSSNNFVDEKLIPNVSHALQRCIRHAIAEPQRLSGNGQCPQFSFRPHWAQTVREAH